jgi:hypothetical protein
LDPPLGWPWPKHECFSASTKTLVDPVQFPPSFSLTSEQYATLGVVTAAQLRSSLRIEVACHDGIILNLTPVHNGHVGLNAREAARVFYFRDGADYSLVHQAERLISHLVVVKHGNHGSATAYTTDSGAWIGSGSYRRSLTTARRESPSCDPLAEVVFYWSDQVGWVAIDWSYLANLPSAGDITFFDERCRGLYGLVLRQERIALFRYRLMQDFLSEEGYFRSLDPAAVEIARTDLDSFRVRLRKNGHGHIYLAAVDHQLSLRV